MITFYNTNIYANDATGDASLDLTGFKHSFIENQNTSNIEISSYLNNRKGRLPMAPKTTCDRSTHYSTVAVLGQS